MKWMWIIPELQGSAYSRISQVQKHPSVSAPDTMGLLPYLRNVPVSGYLFPEFLLLLTSHYFPTQTLKTLINTELFVILLVDK